MSETDVEMLRLYQVASQKRILNAAGTPQCAHQSSLTDRNLVLLTHARMLACRVCQVITTREIMLLPAVGHAVVVADVAAARCWLRRYATCGVHGRRCFMMVSWFVVFLVTKERGEWYGGSGKL